MKYQTSGRHGYVTVSEKDKEAFRDLVSAANRAVSDSCEPPADAKLSSVAMLAMTTKTVDIIRSVLDKHSKVDAPLSRLDIVRHFQERYAPFSVPLNDYVRPSFFARSGFEALVKDVAFHSRRYVHDDAIPFLQHAVEAYILHLMREVVTDVRKKGRSTIFMNDIRNAAIKNYIRGRLSRV
jgi:histone H3/H4